MTTGRVLIVGASRGIGLGLVRSYLDDGWTVHATTRTPEAPGELGSLAGPIVVHGFDVLDETDGLIPSVGGLDVLIHNAGVGRGTPRGLMMAVNAEAPIRVAQDFLDAGALTTGGKVVLVTSQMGARRGSTGSLGDYGDSKAALNDEFRARADAWRDAGIVAIVMHPGWVRTDMGGEAAPLSIEESAEGMRSLISTLGPDHHGRFWTWDGREHPW
ncbi:MAG TPA: SDR family NAD(P)-dependent oxidoreductase [Acidimicrobiia bacterium]|nr:SDR family NAD(P)-dependent oxidoreductase [Acidimicrobiia bacterium]